MGNLFDIAEELANVEVRREYAPVPPGKYTVLIRNAELRATNAGNGEYVKVEFEVTDGRHAGRRFWENFNTKNPNPTAQKMGRDNLGMVQKLCGIPLLNDTDLLIGHVIPVNVTIGPNNRDSTKMENKLRFELPADAVVDTSSQRPAAPTAAPAASAAASRAPAWAAKRAAVA